MKYRIRPSPASWGPTDNITNRWYRINLIDVELLCEYQSTIGRATRRENVSYAIAESIVKSTVRVEFESVEFWGAEDSVAGIENIETTTAEKLANGEVVAAEAGTCVCNDEVKRL